MPHPLSGLLLFWETLLKIKRTLKKILGLLNKEAAPSYKWDESHTVITDYAQFSGMSVGEVEAAVNSYKSLTKAEWETLPPGKFAEKAQKFYAISTHYICDILAANVSIDALTNKLNGYSTELLGVIQNHPGKRLLEFGGGTGVFCQIASKMGKEVTYLDIPGRPFEFAKWRFEKYGLPIRMLQTVPGVLDLTETYDIIFTDAVMEHLDDPLTPTGILCDHLSPGGVLIMLVDLAGEEEDMPMHKDVDILQLHKVPEGRGLECLYGRHQFASIWKKPA
jgi:2-polyprenyl-3-methyl-5-hydroxy-6-metoxy-1,4-benzoquinol methylase